MNNLIKKTGAFAKIFCLDSIQYN